MNTLPKYSVVKRDNKYYLYDVYNRVFHTVPFVTLWGTTPVNYSTESLEEAKEMADKVSYEYVE